MFVKSVFASVLVFALAATAHAREITTNQIHMPDAPKWVTRSRVDKVVDHMQMVLGWDIRKIQVLFFKDEASFEKAQHFGAAVIAVSVPSQKVMYLGPKVTDKNFDGVFGHEIVHIISYQKFKGAIPKWLEEGLANYLSKARKVDYKFLIKHPFPKDVRGLVHPVSGTMDNIQYNYMASQALAEMIASKCDIFELLTLTVGRKMDNYLDTYCEIPDLNAAFQKWVKRKAGE